MNLLRHPQPMFGRLTNFGSGVNPLLLSRPEKTPQKPATHLRFRSKNLRRTGLLHRNSHASVFFSIANSFPP
jgi:hypothetical protein